MAPDSTPERQPLLPQGQNRESLFRGAWPIPYQFAAPATRYAAELQGLTEMEPCSLLTQPHVRLPVLYGALLM